MRPRNNRGSNLSETGPALFIFFLGILFPMIDLLSIAFIYATCWYINFTVANQAARARESERDTIVTGVQKQIYNSGFASFLKIKDGDIKTDVNYPAVEAGLPAVLQCTTTVTGKPLVTLPAGGIIPAVPGLSAPVTFSISTEMTRESTLK